MRVSSGASGQTAEKRTVFRGQGEALGLMGTGRLAPDGAPRHVPISPGAFAMPAYAGTYGGRSAVSCLRAATRKSGGREGA